MADIREEIARAAGPVLWNAGNYPRKAQPHMLGQDTAPLRDLVVDAPCKPERRISEIPVIEPAIFKTYPEEDA